MGVNATPVVGRIRLTAPIASTLARLRIDGENAKALALKLESELVDEESSTTSTDAESEEKKLQALSEKGSVVVEETIERLVEKAVPGPDDPTEDQVLLQVSCFDGYFFNTSSLLFDHRTLALESLR
jgi:hypothetical protein